MDPGRIDTAKRKKFNIRPAVVTLAVLVPLVATPLLFWNLSRPHSPVLSSTNVPADSSPPFQWNWDDSLSPAGKAAKPQRPIYPYSVIPGGVINAKELQTTLRRDPLVAQHYSGFQARHARVLRLAHERRAYVSYRFGNRIFWTKKKVLLPAGETLLTDGTHLARTRCGNRISEVPAKPVSPSEPTEKQLNAPVLPYSPQATSNSPIADPSWLNASNPLSLLPPGSLQPGGPGFPLLPPFPCCGPSSGKPSPSPLPQPGPPVVSTPEPSAFVLLLLGLASLLFIFELRRR